MELKEKLLLLKDICESIGYTKYAKAIQTYLEKLEEPVSIMLVGEGKYGKSCLLNGLLGRHVATEGYIEKSANKNYYRAVNGKEYVSERPFGKEEEECLELSGEKELLECYENFRIKKAENIYWSLNLEWPEPGIVVIDSEGYNQFNAHFRMAHSELDLNDGAHIVTEDLFDEIYYEADVIIWCVKCRKFNGNSTIEKYKEVKVYNKPIFIVYTFADQELDDEDLEEIETEEDLIADMHIRLGDLAENCINEFAGFAGDKNITRKEAFLKKLRTVLTDYVKNENVKNDVGERLFAGIYNEISNKISINLEEQRALFENFLVCKEELVDRGNRIISENSQYIKLLLGKMRASIKHDTYYDNVYRETGYNQSKSFEIIEAYYNTLFENEELHKIIDVCLPENEELLVNEFLLKKEFIVEAGYEKKDWTALWEIRTQLFSELKSKASGFLGGWKEREFRNYFDTLYTTWRKAILSAFQSLVRAFKVGFSEYILQTYQRTVKEFAEELLYKECLGQRLEKIGREEIDTPSECRVYALEKRRKIVCLEGENGVLYDTFRKYVGDTTAIEEILLQEYMEPSMDELDELQPAPEDFFELSRVQVLSQDLQRAKNFDTQRMQNYYAVRRELYQKNAEILKRSNTSVQYEDFRKKAASWLLEVVEPELEALFLYWKNGFYEFLYDYEKEGELKAIPYYSFNLFLERTESEECKLYGVLFENPEEAGEILWNSKKYPDSSEEERKLLKKEAFSFIDGWKKRVHLEEEEHNKKIIAVDKELCKQQIRRQLVKIEREVEVLIFLNKIQIAQEERVYSLKKKIGQVEEVSEKDAEAMVLNYEKLEKKLFGDFCNCIFYKDFREDLRRWFEKNRDAVLQRCIERVRKQEVK